MANMREVNKAIKAAFPNLKIELVRGDGYAYFDGDDGFGKFESIVSHPPVTATDAMIRMALDTIETTLKENAAFEAEVAAKVAAAEVNKAESLPPGTYTVKVVSPLEVVVVGGAYSGRTIVGFGPSLICGVTTRRDVAFGNIPRVSPKARSYQKLAVVETLKAFLEANRTITLDSCGAPFGDQLWFDDCEVVKPKKNKGPVKRKDWMGRGGDRHDARARTR